MRYQTEDTKAGEVVMRRIQAAKDDDSVWDVLTPRMEETIEIFHEYVKRYNLPIDYSTVVCEVGAERCQRILAVVHTFNILNSFAIDLSGDMLLQSRKVAKHYNIRDDGLVRLEGDVLSFTRIEPPPDIIFAIATVHHFPDPRPLFQHVHKLLSPKGYFIFDREPLQSWLGLHEVVRWWRAKGPVRDREWGILEEQFSLKEWREAFAYFDWSEVRISFPPFKRKFKVRWFHRITGGRLSGILRK